MNKCQKEFLKMLEYTKTNEIELTEKDIYSIRKYITTGITLENDSQKEIFFKGVEIMSPKCYQMILQQILNKKTNIEETIKYWTNAFSSP